MVSSLVRPVRKLVETLVASHSPRELAAGFALGMVLGLVPKGNLIALSLVVLLFSLRVNTGIGLLAALVFTWAGAILDPFAHKTGVYLLSFESLQSTYSTALRMPLGPWWGFNNTVVAGSFAVGLYFMYPAYFLSHGVFRWMAPPEDSTTSPLEGGPRLFVAEAPEATAERRAA